MHLQAKGALQKNYIGFMDWNHSNGLDSCVQNGIDPKCMQFSVRHRIIQSWQICLIDLSACPLIVRYVLALSALLPVFPCIIQCFATQLLQWHLEEQYRRYCLRQEALARDRMAHTGRLSATVPLTTAATLASAGSASAGAAAVSSSVAATATATAAGSSADVTANHFSSNSGASDLDQSVSDDAEDEFSSASSTRGGTDVPPVATSSSSAAATSADLAGATIAGSLVPPHQPRQHRHHHHHHHHAHDSSQHRHALPHSDHDQPVAGGASTQSERDAYRTKLERTLGNYLLFACFELM